MSVLGIDVSKADFHCCLDARDKRAEERFANTKSGFRKLQRWLKENRAGAVHACMESSGPYWRDLATSLHRAKLTVSVVNPTRTVHFARSQMRRTKTDRVDARMLAEYCASQHPARWEPDRKEILSLRGLLTYRERLVEQRTALRQTVQSIEIGRKLRALNDAHLDSIESMIAEVNRQIAALIDADVALSEDVALLRSVPSIGLQTAATIVAHLPVQRLHSAKAAAAYAGVTPGERQSGTSVNGKPRICKTGNAQLRRALYMPALVAMQHEPRLKAFAARLKARGKHGKQIVVAVMHKLIRLAYGLLKNRCAYRVATP